MSSTYKSASARSTIQIQPGLLPFRYILLVGWIVGALLSPGQADAIDVKLVGIFGSKAVLVVDGGRPRTLAAGQRSPEGVRLVDVSAATNSVRIEVDGAARTLEFGREPVRVEDAPALDSTLTLTADDRGHHFAEGSINGASLRFIVDTGATTISLGLNDAKRARINLEGAAPVAIHTAAGVAKAWAVRLDTVKVGPLVLHGVEAIVMENDLPIALLGMSFLKRTQMDREGDRLTLRKRF